MNNGIVHLWDLPKSKIYVDLEPNFKLLLLNKCKSVAGTWANLGRELGLKINEKRQCKTLEGIKEGKKIRLDVLFSLRDYLSKNQIEIELEEIEKNVKLIASKCNRTKTKFANYILNPKLPFNFNTKDGAVLLAALLHDGGINNNWIPHYSNTKPELRIKVYKAFVNVFGEIVGKKSNPRINQQIYFPKVVGIILVECLGMKYGRKTRNDPTIPQFIFSSSKKIKASFLRQAFDDEGWIHNTHIGLKLAVEVKNFSEEIIPTLKTSHPIDYAPKLLIDDMKLLNCMGIETKGPYCTEIYFTKDKKCGSKWEIIINGKENLIKFEKQINFSLKERRFKLRNLIASLPYVYPSEKVEPLILITCKKIQEKYGYITSKKLSKEIKRSQSRAKQAIRKLVRKGILKVKIPRHGRIGTRYVFEEDAWEEL
ncbi:MAG: hypothetical protein QXP77_01765 [Candidatus Aenigmatarchaeota archaeon]